MNETRTTVGILSEEAKRPAPETNRAVCVDILYAVSRHAHDELSRLDLARHPLVGDRFVRGHHDGIPRALPSYYRLLWLLLYSRDRQTFVRVARENICDGVIELYRAFRERFQKHVQIPVALVIGEPPPFRVYAGERECRADFETAAENLLAVPEYRQAALEYASCVQNLLEIVAARTRRKGNTFGL